MDIQETETFIPQASPDPGLEKKSTCTKIHSIFSPCLLSKSTLDPTDGYCSKIVYGLLCPPHGKVGQLLTYCLLVILIWTTAFVMLGRVAVPSQEKIDVSIQGG